MTRDEILNMPEGSEIDALIAEKIMRTPHRKPSHGPCCTCQTCGWDFDSCKCGYSTDIDAAWQVMEKLTKRYRVTLENHQNGYGIMLDNFPATIGVWAETAPLAICRAALLTITEVEL